MASPNFGTVIRNVRLPCTEQYSGTSTWDIACLDGRVQSITSSGSCVPHDEATIIEADGGVILPSLCHSHIHLDKCFILGQCDPLITGSLPEALRVTNKAKAEFPNDVDNLYARATHLIRESVEAGVTAMRAFVEVDTTVGFACLDMGLQLAKEWAKLSRKRRSTSLLLQQNPVQITVCFAKQFLARAFLSSALRLGSNLTTHVLSRTSNTYCLSLNCTTYTQTFIWITISIRMPFRWSGMY